MMIQLLHRSPVLSPTLNNREIRILISKNLFHFLRFLTITESEAKFHWDQWGSTTSDQQLYVVLSSGAKTEYVEAGLKKIFEDNLGADAKKNNYTWNFSSYNL